MNTQQWIDHAKEKLHIETDNQLAKRLGTSRGRISNYRTGKHQMDPEFCLTIENALGLKRGTVLVDIQAEREHNPKVKAAWRSLHKSIAACLMIAATLPMYFLHGGTLYIMLNRLPHPKKPVYT